MVGKLGWPTVLVALLAAASPAPATAHETTPVAGVRVTVGWAEEPAFAGILNGVEVTVTDSSGAGAVDPKATLVVQVGVGEERITIPLNPSTAPGEYVAPLIPTTAGTYRFHVTGTLFGQAVSILSTCSDETFDCVSEPASIQFPTEEPSGAEIDRRIDRIAKRAESARSLASGSRDVATVALVVAVLTLLVAGSLLFALSRRRKGV